MSGGVEVSLGVGLSVRFGIEVPNARVSLALAHHLVKRCDGGLTPKDRSNSWYSPHGANDFHHQ